MIDKKTRIKLRSLASTIKPIVWVGKDGFSEKVLKQIDDELFNHELIKISMQENTTPPTEFELTEMAVKLGAEVVTTIGRKIVLYKHSEKKGIKHVL
ncbi:MAG: YhbY family RNA-binding protein [Clostridia bacterium]|nr:YhbY family RNA-binding protein [Clostridia bacterium]